MGVSEGHINRTECPLEALLTFLVVFIPLTLLATIWYLLSRLAHRHPLTGIATTVAVVFIPMCAPLVGLAAYTSELENQVVALESDVVHMVEQEAALRRSETVLMADLSQCHEDAGNAFERGYSEGYERYLGSVSYDEQGSGRGYFDGGTGGQGTVVVDPIYGGRYPDEETAVVGMGTDALLMMAGIPPFMSLISALVE